MSIEPASCKGSGPSQPVDLFHGRHHVVKDPDLYLMESEVQKAESKPEGYWDTHS